LAQTLPSISWQRGGGPIDACQRRKPPEAVAEGQRLQGFIDPAESSAEVGAERQWAGSDGERSSVRTAGAAGYARILTAANTRQAGIKCLADTNMPSRKMQLIA